MVTPHRPQLGPVLDALVDSDGREVPSWWLTNRVAVVARANAHEVIIEARGHFVAWPWRTTDVAEAWEILQARDLVPLDCRARFVCARCEGTGVPGHLVDTACLDCDGGHRPHPPTVAALASWASLGWRATDDGHPGIAGAEEWAREMVGVREVWWRVGPVEASGVVLGPAHPGLARAGLGWSWSGRRPDGVTLTVPPLGSAR